VTSPDSNRDLATAILFTPDPILVPSTDVAAQHVVQLRSAVNAVRTLAGLGPFAFEDPALTPQMHTIRAIHINQLRQALDEARTLLSLPGLVYVRNPVTSNHDVDDIDFVELRGGVK
jgi:hypothetical protein